MYFARCYQSILQAHGCEILLGVKKSDDLNILDLMITFPECWSHNCMRTYNWKISQCKSVRTKSSGVENMKCNLVLGPKHKLRTLKWQNPGILHEPQDNSGRKKWIELKEIVGELEGKWQGKGEISSSHLSNFYFLASNPPFIPFWTMLTCT